MKEGIFNSLNLDSKLAKKLVSKIKVNELRFIKEADLVVSISKDEAKYFRDNGAKNVCIVPNGISKEAFSQSNTKHWKEFFNKESIAKPILFVGSGHPPNYTGFLEMFGDDSTFLNNGEKVLMAGGVSDYFKHEYSLDKVGKDAYVKFWKNIIAVGKLSESDLAAPIDISEIIMLPITTGGGSNLKTAEAILADKKIIATPYAFRGFEIYQSLPNTYLASTHEEFVMQLKKSTKHEQTLRSDQEKVLAGSVQWSECVRSLQQPTIDLLAQPKLRYTKPRLRKFWKKISIYDR